MAEERRYFVTSAGPTGVRAMYEQRNGVKVLLQEWEDDGGEEPPPTGDNPLVSSFMNQQQYQRAKARFAGTIEATVDAKTKELIIKDNARITTYLENFMADPDSQRWRMSTTSPIPVDSPDPFGAGDYMLAAAYYCFLKKDTPGGNPSASAVAQTVITELVAQANEWTTDFAYGYLPTDPSSKTRRWIYNPSCDRNPYFFSMDILKKFTHIFEMVKWAFTSSATDVAKRKQIVTWLFNGGVYARQRTLDTYLNDKWSKVISGTRDYTRRYVRDYSATNWTQVSPDYMYSYINGSNVWTTSLPTYPVHKAQSNRRGCFAAALKTLYYALRDETAYLDLSKVGQFIPAQLIGPGSGQTYYAPNLSQCIAEIDMFDLSATLYSEEVIKYSIFPNGAISDWYRTLKDKVVGQNGLNNWVGYQYGLIMICQFVDVAYLDALHGNMNLLNLSTSIGRHGTEGGPKSLMKVVELLIDMVTENVEYYATLLESTVRDENRSYLINSRKGTAANEVFAWHRFWHQANMFLDNPTLKGFIAQTTSGLPSYPGYGLIQGGAQSSMFGGPWNTWPASASMFACMEDIPPTTFD